MIRRQKRRQFKLSERSKVLPTSLSVRYRSRNNTPLIKRLLTIKGSLARQEHRATWATLMCLACRGTLNITQLAAMEKASKLPRVHGVVSAAWAAVLRMWPALAAKDRPSRR